MSNQDKDKNTPASAPPLARRTPGEASVAANRLARRLTEIDARIGAEARSGYTPPPLGETPEEQAARDVVRIASAIADGETDKLPKATGTETGSQLQTDIHAKQQAFQALIQQSSRVQAQLQARNAMTSEAPAKQSFPQLSYQPAVSEPDLSSSPMSQDPQSVPAAEAPISSATPDPIVSPLGEAGQLPNTHASRPPMPAILAHEPSTYAPELAEPRETASQNDTTAGPVAQWRDNRPIAMFGLAACGFAVMIGGAIFALGSVSLEDTLTRLTPAALSDGNETDGTTARQSDTPSITEVRTVNVDPVTGSATMTQASDVPSQVVDKPGIIRAVSGRAVSLPVTLEGPIEQGSSNATGYVRLDNVPAGARLSVGRRIAERAWIVPETQADQILMIVTLNAIAKTATYEIAAQHVGADKLTPLGALQELRVEVSAASQQVAESAPSADQGATAVNDPPRPLATSEVRRLIMRGNQLMRDGKVAEAREAFAEATLANVPEADLAMGQAYDAFYISKVQSNAKPNIKRARFWYQKAAEKGSETAMRKLERLGGA